MVKWNAKVLVTQSCPTLCNPMDCGPPSSSVRGILQARTLAWIAIPFSRGSSQPRNWRPVSCTVGKFFTNWGTKGIPQMVKYLPATWETWVQSQGWGINWDEVRGAPGAQNWRRRCLSGSCKCSLKSCVLVPNVGLHPTLFSSNWVIRYAEDQTLQLWVKCKQAPVQPSRYPATEGSKRQRGSPGEV